MKQLLTILFLFIGLAVSAQPFSQVFPHGNPIALDSFAGAVKAMKAIYLPFYADPDSLYGLAVDVNGKVYPKLFSGGGGSGTVTSITAGRNLLGGTITTSGILTPDTSAGHLATKTDLLAKLNSTDTTYLKRKSDSLLNQGYATHYQVDSAKAAIRAAIAAIPTSADSSIFSTRYRNDTGNAAIRVTLSTKVNYTDTASMLANYLRSALGVKYADTSTMLANYLRSALGVKYTDTAGMLTAYKRYADSLATEGYVTHYQDDTAKARLTTAIAAKGAGSVTSVGTGYGLSGGPITTSGTLIVDTSTLFTKIVTTFGAGTGISILGRTFTNTAPDQTVSIANGYGMTFTGTYPNFTGTLDTATAFTKYATTEAAGYGLTHGGRTYILDSATFAVYLNSTLAAGYGILHNGRTFIFDTATAFTYGLGTLAGGYGITYTGRTFKADTATTFAKMATTMGAGYGLSYGGRTYSTDTGTLFTYAFGTLAAGTGISIGGRTISATFTPSSTNTLTNKRWTARVGNTTSSATPTINTDNVDIYKLTAQAADITSFTTNLSGTPVDGDILEIQITGTAARAITWGASFVSGVQSLPTTTVTTTTLTVILQYFTTSSYGNNKWVYSPE